MFKLSSVLYEAIILEMAIRIKFNILAISSTNRNDIIYATSEAIIMIAVIFLEKTKNL